MSVTSTSPGAQRSRFAGRRPEVILGGLSIIALLFAAIRVNYAYSGLPAHPLFLHVPVILVPLATIAALWLAARPGNFARQGIPVAIVSVIALASLNLTMAAGEALREDLHLEGRESVVPHTPQATLVAQHAAAADQLRIAFVLFTALLLIALTLLRSSDRFGIRPIDAVVVRLRREPVLILVRIGLVILGALSLYLVLRVGDLGAKAVWQGTRHGLPPRI